MPAPTTLDEFFDCVRKSGLLEPAKFEAFLATRAAGFETPAGAAASLLADGLLTPFHTGQLLRGKHKGFFLGRYRILDRIGLGGMGQVFLAEHGAMRRRAALKVLPPERSANEYSRARFLREARASAQLDHPNLVRAFDFDQEGEVAFLVMEFVDGVTFHDLVARSGPLEPNRAAHYLWQSANGLSYLHDRGMIHRDVKPANVLVDRQGVVKILDLGLVRSETDVENLTQGEGVKILGTADYLPPEQAIDCSAVDRRADIYGLGATAYYLLTGRPPFVGEKVAQKLIAHQMQAVTPVRAVRPEVPEGLSAAVTRMLAQAARGPLPDAPGGDGGDRAVGGAPARAAERRRDPGRGRRGGPGRASQPGAAALDSRLAGVRQRLGDQVPQRLETHRRGVRGARDRRADARRRPGGAARQRHPRGRARRRPFAAPAPRPPLRRAGRVAPRAAGGREIQSAPAGAGVPRRRGRSRGRRLGRPRPARRGGGRPGGDDGLVARRVSS